jgi:hypothetical protein
MDPQQHTIDILEVQQRIRKFSNDKQSDIGSLVEP